MHFQRRYRQASGCRAAGQFGFRRRRSTAQAALALRVLQDKHRNSGQQLWACFVDFKKAYDSVPRARMWAKLQQRCLGGNWLRAVQALCADVPMSVRTADGLSRCFQARLGLKQGCPLSPTLFGLDIDDFEEQLLQAAQRGEQLDLPVLEGSSGPMPPLLYADDTTLGSSAAPGGPAAIVLPAVGSDGQHSQDQVAAPQRAAKQPGCICGCSAPWLTPCSRTAQRCGTYSWQPRQLPATAALVVRLSGCTSASCVTCSACGKAHPAASYWQNLVSGHSGPAGWFGQQKCGTGGWQQGSTACFGRQSQPVQQWHAHLVRASHPVSHGRSTLPRMAAVGVQLDMAHPRPISIAAVRSGCQQRQLQLLQTAAARDGASKLQQYVQDVCGGKLEPASTGAPATYLCVIRERGRREALAQWRAGSHWGAEETGGWQQIPRDQRLARTVAVARRQ